MPSFILLEAGSDGIPAQFLKQLELWSGYQCDGGVRLAIIADPLTCQASFRLTGEDEFALVLPLTTSVRTDLIERRVIRVTESDVVFDEWRIMGVTQDTDKNTITVTGAAAHTDLGLCGVITETNANRVSLTVEVKGLTPTDIIDEVILPNLTAMGITWVARGIVEYTGPIDATIDWATPLEALRRIADATGMEFQLRRNGAVNYLIDLVEARGAGANIADVRLGKNLEGLKQQRTQGGQVTRAAPRGARSDGISATMAGAVWEVTNVAGSVLTLADPAGGDAPVAFDDQLNGRYLRKADGTLTQVTDSVASLDTVTVASATGISVGHLVQFRLNASGDEMTYLDSPADQAAWGIVHGTIDAPDLPGHINLIRNPALRSWSGGLPVSWSLVGAPTVSQETNPQFLDRGPIAAKVVCFAPGQGLVTSAVPVAPTALDPHGSGFVMVYPATDNSVKVELVVNGATVRPPSPGVASNAESGRYTNVGVSGDDFQALGATTVALRITSLGATTFYVAGGQFSQTASQADFVEGSGGTQLWQAANRVLVSRGGLQQVYELTLIDLARLDPDTWSTDTALVLGGDARVTDERVGVQIQTRVTEIAPLDYLTRGSTKITLSSAPEDLLGTLGRPQALARPRRTGLSTVPAISNLALLSDATTASRLPDGSAQARIRVTFAPPVDSFIKRYELRGRIVGTEPWVDFPSITPAECIAYVPVSSGENWEIGVRAVNIAETPGPWTATTLESGSVTVERFYRTVLTNGDGQTGVVGSAAAGWTPGGGNGVFIDNTHVKFGDRSLTITNGTAVHSHNSQSWSASEGEVWRITGWLWSSGSMTGGSTEGVGLELAGSAGITVLDTIDSEAPLLSGTTNTRWIGLPKTHSGGLWVQVSGVFLVATGSGTLSLRLSIGFSGSGPTGQGWYDGVIAERLEAAVEQGGKRGYDVIDGSGNIYVDTGSGGTILPHEQDGSGSFAKALTMSGLAWQALDSTVPYLIHQRDTPTVFGAWLSVETSGDTYIFAAPFTLAPGTTITQVSVGTYRGSSSDTVVIALKRAEVGGITTVSSGSASVGRSSVVLSVAELTTSSRFYWLTASLTPSLPGETEVSGISIAYSMPDFTASI